MGVADWVITAMLAPLLLFFAAALVMGAIREARQTWRRARHTPLLETRWDDKEAGRGPLWVNLLQWVAGVTTMILAVPWFYWAGEHWLDVWLQALGVAWFGVVAFSLVGLALGRRDT